jgi:glucose 1-dehydrogenase
MIRNAITLYYRLDRGFYHNWVRTIWDGKIDPVHLRDSISPPVEDLRLRELRPKGERKFRNLFGVGIFDFIYQGSALPEISLTKSTSVEYDEHIFDNLENKTCIITGGTRGLGEATAKLFAKLGANVVITGRDEERGKRLQSSTKGITFRRADFENREDVTDLLKWLDRNYSSIDVLISNAARNSRFDLLNIEVQEWDRMLNLLLTTPFLLSRWAAKKMIDQKKKGKIIVVSAIQAISPLEHSFAYATCKGGLISMVRSMATDLGRHGIQVMAVLPGPFYIKDEPMPEGLDSRAASILGRMGRPNEMAKLLAFLASDNNTFMTGNTIVVDGGRLISRKADPQEIQLQTI